MESNVAFVHLLFTLGQGNHLSVDAAVVFGKGPLTLHNSAEKNNSITHPDGPLAQTILLNDLTYALHKIFSMEVAKVELISYVDGMHRMDVLQLPQRCVLSGVFPINFDKPTYSFWIKQNGNIKQVS